MEKSMERLYAAAKLLRKIVGQSELARALNESPQTVKNWESRGVSKSGMIKAQKIIGCSAVWIETGNESMAPHMPMGNTDPVLPRRINAHIGTNVKKNLVTLMRKHKVNSNSLALAVKIPQPTIHRILSSESQDPRTSTLEPIATYFGVTVSDLREKDVNEIGLTFNTKNACAFVPLIAWAQAGEIAYMVDVEGSEQIPTTVEKGRHTFALEVVGDAMSPDFPPGMRLIVEPDMGHQAGDYVIVHSGGQATFKQLVRDGADWYLKPINPQYPTKSLGNARIIGVVREALRKLR